MNKIFVFLLLATHYSVFAQTKTDSAKVVRLLINDYEALGKFDISKHVRNCTSDYLLIENGEIWDLKKEIEYFKSNANRQIERTNKFDIKTVKIIGNAAYAVYDLQSELIEDGQTKSYHWVESAVFRRAEIDWKIAVIHSTKIEIKK